MIPDPQLGHASFKPFNLTVLKEQRDQEISKVIHMKPTSHDLANRHTYHPPQPGQPQKYEAIRAFAHDFAKLINDLCPDSRELSIAHTRIEEAVFWANASIAREDKD